MGKQVWTSMRVFLWDSAQIPIHNTDLGTSKIEAEDAFCGRTHPLDTHLVVIQKTPGVLRTKRKPEKRWGEMRFGTVEDVIKIGIMRPMRENTVKSVWYKFEVIWITWQPCNVWYNKDRKRALPIDGQPPALLVEVTATVGELGAVTSSLLSE